MNDEYELKLAVDII